MEGKQTLLNIKSFSFGVNTNIKFGIDEALNLNKYIAELGYKKIGIVIDKDVYNTEYGQKVALVIPISKILLYEWNEPTYALLEEHRNFFDDSFDCIIGIGGGSVIDFAKGLAFLATNRGNAISYRGFPTDINTPLPVITIPTVSGTGAEVAFNAVFLDSDTKTKLGINTTLNYPKLSILDPKLTVSCPKNLTVYTGMDGMVHLFESHSAKGTNTISQTFSSRAYKLLYSGLEQAIDDLTNIKVRSKLMLGSYLAGIALLNSGGGPTGALSYALGAKFDVPHGLAGAVFLPHIIKFNEKHGFRYEGLFADSKEFFDLYNKVGIDYQSLKQFGINEDNIDVLLKAIEPFQGAFDQNPTEYTVDDAKKMIRSMI